MRNAMKARLHGSPPLYRAAQRSFQLARYLAGRPHEPDFRAFASLPGDGLFLDVGANSGASALSFRLYKPCNPILSIEPSALHAGDLRRVSRLVGNMESILCAAGETTGMSSLHVPYYRGVSLSQFASLKASEAGPESWPIKHLLGEEAYGPGFEVRVQRTPMVRIDDLGVAPDFVKIDVQGLELEVLSGMRQTIDRCRPTFLVEVGGDWEMIDHMRGLGYDPCIFDGASLRPYDGQTTVNMFLLPSVR